MQASAERLYEEMRPRAFAIAYRMLGSVGEAEDIVQETLLRLHRVRESGEEIASPAAYVSTVATRLAIDELRSARARRESYFGEWLPEPLVTGQAPDGIREAVAAAVAPPDPAAAAELSDSLSLAFLVLLESLTPEQRAVFILREVFDYPYGEIAEIVGRSEAATRQLAVRARARVEEGKPRFEPSREQQEELARRFFAAVEEGDFGELESLLAADVELHGDGGGKVPAIARPMYGRLRVAKAISNWVRTGAGRGVTFRPAEVNGGPGAVTVDPEGRVVGVIGLEIAGGAIVALRSIVNPEKLDHLGEVGDLRALIRQRSQQP